MQPQRQSHVIFALLMAVLLLLPLIGLFAKPAAGQARQAHIKTNGNSKHIAHPQNNVTNVSVENAWRTSLIRGAYVFNPHLSSFNIEAKVEGRQAVLQGSVPTGAQRALAEQVALTIEGIDYVVNQITISHSSHSAAEGTERLAKTSFTDAAVTTKVKSQLLANTETSGLAIDVITQDRVVTLVGQVNNDVERELAYYITRNTGGVRQVVNKLQVRPQV